MKPPKLEYAVVVGSGAFPWDMLRYDFCSPATEADDAHALERIEWAAVMEKEEPFPFRAVVLKRWKVAGDWTPARWKSQGWDMLGVFPEYSLEEARRKGLEAVKRLEDRRTASREQHVQK